MIRARTAAAAGAAVAALHSICVDGITTAYPSRYEHHLERENVFGPGREDGADPCPG